MLKVLFLHLNGALADRDKPGQYDPAMECLLICFKSAFDSFGFVLLGFYLSFFNEELLSVLEARVSHAVVLVDCVLRQVGKEHNVPSEAVEQIDVRKDLLQLLLVLFALVFGTLTVDFDRQGVFEEALRVG